jgi:hypothetical protein
MQITLRDSKSNRTAVVSVFFEVGNYSSEFLASLGFDPAKNPKVADMIQNLTTNEELSLENTQIDLSDVSLSNSKIR